MHIYSGQMYPLPIDHRSMEYCYTTELSHIAVCTYTKAPLLQSDHRSMVYHYTKYILKYSRMHIYLGQMDPPPTDHRCMEYHYTKKVSQIAECTYTKAPLLQLTIDVWNTTTLNTVSHIAQCTYT